jgi:hypothetical protein
MGFDTGVKASMAAASAPLLLFIVIGDGLEGSLRQYQSLREASLPDF